MRDPFVGIVKGVILSRSPSARIVDLSHGIPPQDLRAAALALRSAVDYFPENTLFVCVVDPGVGSQRRILWARSDRHQFLAPDNGLLSWAAALRPLKELREVRNRRLFLRGVGSTFHGRDRFAPVAAQLHEGLEPARLGPRVRSFARIPFPPVQRSGRALIGEILVVDHFGNAVTNLESSRLKGRRIRFAGRDLGPLRPSYSSVPRGSAVVVSGSLGLAELSVREGDFARDFAARVGDPVHA